MSERNGGPYTKPEQEQRRKTVFDLHFEKGQSALKISEALNVNRNTINDDIRFWYDELASDLKSYNIEGWAAKQYYRMEEQCERLMELLQKQQSISHIITIEKMILELDRTILKFITPIISKQKQEISDSEAVETIEYLLMNEDVGKAHGYSKDGSMRDIIQYKKCDLEHAQKIISKIEGLGLNLFASQDNLVEIQRFDLLEFAKTRGILSGEKIDQMNQRIQQREIESKEEIVKIRKREKEIEAKYVAQYGPESDWSREIWEQFVAETEEHDLESPVTDASQNMSQNTSQDGPGPP